MPVFIVKRTLPGVTADGLKSAGQRAKTCCADMSREGTSVRWIRSFFLPDSSQTHCYFEGASREVVEEANRRAQLPFIEVTQAVEMTPESV